MAVPGFCLLANLNPTAQKKTHWNFQMGQLCLLYDLWGVVAWKKQRFNKDQFNYIVVISIWRIICVENKTPGLPFLGKRIGPMEIGPLGSQRDQIHIFFFMFGIWPGRGDWKTGKLENLKREFQGKDCIWRYDDSWVKVGHLKSRNPGSAPKKKSSWLQDWELY